MASTMEVVARARTADGQDAVLKVAIPEALGASVDQVNPNPREAYGGAVRNPAPGVGHASTPDGGACSGESADARSAGRATVGRTWPSVLRRVRDRAGARPPTGCGLRPRPDAWSSTATPTAPTSSRSGSPVLCAACRRDRGRGEDDLAMGLLGAGLHRPLRPCLRRQRRRSTVPRHGRATRLRVPHRRSGMEGSRRGRPGRRRWRCG